MVRREHRRKRGHVAQPLDAGYLCLAPPRTPARYTISRIHAEDEGTRKPTPPAALEAQRHGGENEGKGKREKGKGKGKREKGKEEKQKDDPQITQIDTD